MGYQEDKKEAITNLTVHGGIAHVSPLVDIGFAVLEVVSELINMTLGLKPTW